MKLSEIFNQLTYGELSQIHLGGADVGVIDETNYPKILAHINLGLTALYKRFPIKEGRVKLDLSPGVYTYPILSKYAVNNKRSTETNRFILDTAAEPFRDDVLKIERVYTDDKVELWLNNEADAYSCFTPTATTLRVPKEVTDWTADYPEYLKTSKLELVYRANPLPITVCMCLFDPTRVEVELPYSHLEPLLLFVASRVHNPVGMDGGFNAGNNYAIKYEAACQQLELLNLRVDQGSQSSRLERNGWV